MTVYVIDPYQTTTPHFPIVGLISDFYSMIWNVQLYGLGYFEITLPATTENISTLTEGRFLVRESDIRKRNPGDTKPEYQNCMIIREVNFQYNIDHGYVLKIVGKGVKDVISQRIVWEPYECVGKDLTEIIVDLLDANVIDPKSVADDLVDDAIDKQMAAIAAVQTALIIKQSAYQTLAAAIIAYNSAVAQYGESSPEAEAAFATMESAQDTYDTAKSDYSAAVSAKNKADQALVYYGQYQQMAASRQIPYITGTVQQIDSPELTLFLQGENLGEWCEEICTEYGLGWNLRIDEDGMDFEFIVGNDYSETVIFSPDMDNLSNATYKRSLEIYRNSGLAVGEGEGTDQIHAYIGDAEGPARYEEFIDTDMTRDPAVSLENYRRMIRQFGQSRITKLEQCESISGEIDIDGVYKIGEDFDLGDVVGVNLDNGIFATTRLIEIIYAEETSGSSVTGTFEEWEVS